MNKEEDCMADKHSYDGIRYREEQKSPFIFRLLFGGLVVWGTLFIGYFLFSGWSSSAEFNQRKKAKEEAVAKASTTGQAVVGTHKEGKAEDYLAMGKAEYAAKCASCHGADGKGTIGPDLTRKEYKYGRTQAAVTESIGNGRPGGMPAFGKELSHEKLEGLVHYVMSL
jgi:cytochrome c oxidase cbb3-type subunit 3